MTDAKQAMSAQMGPNIEGVKEHDQQVTMRDGSKITCRVYQPEMNPPSGGSPLAVGFTSGKKHRHRHKIPDDGQTGLK